MPRADRRGVLLRPLLDVSRDDTRKACAALGLVPWEDPHNTDPRTPGPGSAPALPALVAALGPGGGGNLARTAALLAADTDVLDALAADALRRRPGAGRARRSPPWPPLPAGACAPGCCTPGPGSSARPARAVAPARRRPRRPGHRLARAGAARLPGGIRVVARPGVLVRVPTPVRVVTVAVVRISAGARPGAATGPFPAGRPGTGRPVRRGATSMRQARPMAEGSWYDADIDHVIISEEQIREKTAELAKQVSADYAEVTDGLLLVCVLKGAVMFMADFARALGRHGPSIELEFMAVSSYGQGTTSSGVVRILKDLDRDIAGRHVVIVEDIVDSGLTLSWLMRYLQSRSPASVEVVALFRKPDAVKVHGAGEVRRLRHPERVRRRLRPGLRRALPRTAVRRGAQAGRVRP